MRYETRKLLYRVEYLEAEVDRLAARLASLEVGQRQAPLICGDLWSDWTYGNQVYASETDWSHSDGDAPWSQNYAADKEYEPDERIRGQFK